MLINFANGHVPIFRKSCVQYADSSISKVHNIAIAHRLVLEQAQCLRRLRRNAVNVDDYLGKPQSLYAVGSAISVGIWHYQTQHGVKACVWVLRFVIVVELSQNGFLLGCIGGCMQLFKDITHILKFVIHRCCNWGYCCNSIVNSIIYKPKDKLLHLLLEVFSLLIAAANLMIYYNIHCISNKRFTQ